MTKYQGATDAFNAIVQKVDETLIQAESHFLSLRADAIRDKSDESLPDRTIVPNQSNQSERSCSPDLPCVPSSSAVTGSSAQFRISSSQELQMKSKSYIALDKKKAVVITSLKSKSSIADSEVKKIQQLIESLFGKNSTPSASSSSSSTMDL